MNLFINDSHITLQDFSSEKLSTEFDIQMDLSQGPIKYNQLKGRSLIENAKYPDVKEILRLALAHKFDNLEEICLRVKDFKNIKESLKSSFKVVQAAGGVVYKVPDKEEVLLIYRLGQWDLPKGKLDPNEKFKKAAVREVEEECGVKVKRKGKIITTWHNYTQGRTQILKQTRWYRMELLDDRNMKPQKNEGIVKVEWFKLAQAQESLRNSYKSIQFVMDAYSMQR